VKKKNINGKRGIIKKRRIRVNRRMMMKMRIKDEEKEAEELE
jgi:hypothetical protein